MSVGEKILKKHLPALEENVKELGEKEMTPEVALSVHEKADKILSANFKGETLEAMRKKLRETILELQKNRGKQR